MNLTRWPVFVSVIIFVLSTFIHLSTSQCVRPNKRLAHGRYKFKRREDAKLRVLSEDYLLRFECFKNYTLKGSKAILCYNKRWSDRVPRCIKLSCDDPPSIENGSYKINSGTSYDPVLGSVAVYSCKSGYGFENKTDSNLSCGLSEEHNNPVWKGQIPSCKQLEECSDPGMSTDGKRYGKSFFIGEFVSFECNDEYDLIGNETIQCLPGGNWSSSRPLCRPENVYCKTPAAIEHGVIRGDQTSDYFRPSDEVEIVCEPGYKYTGASSYITCEENGEWDEEFHNCTEIYCNYPDTLVNGTIQEIENMTAADTKDMFPYNFEITYVCNEGFRLIGDSWRFCGKKGWSGSNPHCEIIKCPDPGVPEHGSRSLEGVMNGNKVFYKCSSSFELIGSFERYCMPNGQWSGELARCNHERNYCPDPGIPINGVKNSSNYDLGENVGFRCQSGFNLLGSETRQCLANRTWSGTETRCVGPYEYDNSGMVKNILIQALAEKEEEQKKETEKYKEAVKASFGNGPMGKIIDLNFPGRIVLYFAFDVSGSVGLPNFNKSIDFAKAIVTRIKITDIGARAGALTFGSKADVQFLPTEYTTTEDVIKALGRIKYKGGGTSASSALALIREEMIPLTREIFSARTKIKSVIFILTDGKANMGGDPQEQAKELKAAGVEIYCIGITSNISQASLYKIASSTDEHVFILKDYPTMAWLVQKIINGTIDYSQCGLGLEKLDKNERGKIAGGGKATEPWPWMAALFLTTPDLKLICGGSIVHEWYILTAAHCLYDKDTHELRHEEEIIVKLGLTNIQNETKMEAYEVKKIYKPKEYQYGPNYDYDIALLKLKRPIEFNAFIRPICLPPKELNKVSTLYKKEQNSVAAGWGHNQVVQVMANVIPKLVKDLKEIVLPIQDRDFCQRFLIERKKPNIEYVFTDRMFCVGDGEEGKDTCKGDSGGPLIQSQLNSEGIVYWTQIGIISWGIGCGLPNTYGFYTHVQSLNQWLIETMNPPK